jgi:lysophospholipase L1-like esterase
VVGALDVEPGVHGVTPRRLPAWTRPRISDPVFDFVVGMSSGLRVATRTSAETIELELVVTGISPVGVTPAPAVIDLVVDGVVHSSSVVPLDQQSLIDGTGAIRQVGRPSRIRFDSLGSHEKSIELWLPNTASVELVAIRASAALHPPLDERPVWVHHGSSISQCGEADAPTRTWPALAASHAGVSLRSFGFSGNAVGDPFVARTIRDHPADLISVEIGINVVNGDLMRRRMFESVLHGFLDTVREGHPDAPLLVIGPIPCPALENAPGPSDLDPSTGMCVSRGDARELDRGGLSLTGVRAALASVLAARSDDDRLGYLDGHLLLPPDEVGDLDDGLHPNASAYVRMGDRFARLAFAERGLFASIPASSPAR